MGRRSTVLMILVTTILALGLTVYGEKLDSNNESKTINRNVPSNYKIIQDALRD